MNKYDQEQENKDVSSYIKEIYARYAENPDKTALITVEKELTYRELVSGAVSFSEKLKKLKIKKKSRILLETSDIAGYFTAFLGSMLFGAVVVPVEAGMSIYRLNEIINATKPALIFLHNNGEKYSDYLTGTTDAELNSRSFPDEKNDAAIISTTGTTGRPSLILHTNASLFAAAENLVTGTKISSDTVMLTNMPVYLSTGFLRVMAALISGGTVIFTNKAYNGAMITKCADLYKVNRLSMVSTSLSALVDEYMDKRDSFPSSIRQAESVASVLPGNISLAFHRLFPEVTLYNVYGTTEAGCILIHDTAENYEADCIGKPAVNAEVMLLDENGKKITEPGSYGHVAVSGSMNMKSYYKKKSLTEKVMKGDLIIINDIAYFDQNGYYHFVSRVGDIINVAGQKITPLEVEEAALKYAGIDDCACTKAKDANLGEVPVLYVVKNEKYELNELQKILTENLETYRVPREIYEIGKIPRTATGKVMRHILGI